MKWFGEQCSTKKMKYSIKDFLSKCDQIRSFLLIWSHLLKKSLIENFSFCAVVSLEPPSPLSSAPIEILYGTDIASNK